MSSDSCSSSSSSGYPFPVAVPSDFKEPAPDEGPTSAVLPPLPTEVDPEYWTRERTIALYQRLSKRMPAAQFACIPHPVFVEEDSRLAPIYERVLKGSVRTNVVQIEYHRRCREDPEHVKDHVAWYEETLGLIPTGGSSIPEETESSSSSSSEEAAPPKISVSFMERFVGTPFPAREEPTPRLDTPALEAILERDVTTVDPPHWGGAEESKSSSSE